MSIDISFKSKDWKKQKKVVNKLGKDFSKIVEGAINKNLIYSIKHAKAQEFPNSFRNVTGNLRLSIGSTIDREIKKMKRRGKAVNIDGVTYLSRGMRGNNRVEKTGNKLIGRFIVPMEYASIIESRVGFSVKSLMAKKDTLKKHLDKDIKSYKSKNKID